jgi:hypothetical protein
MFILKVKDILRYALWAKCRIITERKTRWYIKLPLCFKGLNKDFIPFTGVLAAFSLFKFLPTDYDNNDTCFENPETWFYGGVSFKALYSAVRGVHASLFEQVAASGRHASVRGRVPAPIITFLTTGALALLNHTLIYTHVSETGDSEGGEDIGCGIVECDPVWSCERNQSFSERAASIFALNVTKTKRQVGRQKSIA